MSTYRAKHEYRSVAHDSVCVSTGKRHVPTTFEQIRDGVHVKVFACKECGEIIR